MRRQTPLATQLYNYLFPRPTSNDPPSFSAHLAKNLVPEVRIEVAQFYGDLNSVEARYPGLNYCYPPHRMRLGRFKNHRRLFEAFDALALTYSEIQDFCCWEGTKWARERFEADEQRKVIDTTGDEIGPYIDRREMRALEEEKTQRITRKTEISVIVEEASARPRNPTLIEENDEDMSDADSEGEGDGAEHDQTGQRTPRGLSNLEDRRSHLARDSYSMDRSIRRAIEQGSPIPPEVEQYFKEENERETLGASPSMIYPPSSHVPLSGTAASANLTGRASA